MSSTTKLSSFETATIHKFNYTVPNPWEKYNREKKVQFIIYQTNQKSTNNYQMSIFKLAGMEGLKS